MCGSLLSKFKKNSNKVAPVLGAEYLETKRVSTKTNLATETAWVDKNMLPDEVSMGRKTRTTVRMPDLTRFIEVKPYEDTKAGKEENTMSTNNESSRLKPEVQSVNNAIITLRVERTDDHVPPVTEGLEMTTKDSKKHKQKMVASQSDVLSSSKANLSNEITTFTVDKESLASVQSGRFSGCTVKNSTENVFEATNQPALTRIGDNETKLTAPYDDLQETEFVFKALPTDREDNANENENKLSSTSSENYKLDNISVSDAECQSKAEVMSMEIAVTSWSTEVNDPRSSSKVTTQDETTQESNVTVQSGQFSGSRVFGLAGSWLSSIVLEAVDHQVLALIDKDEETLTAAYDDSQETAVFSKALSAENMTAKDNTMSISDETNQSEAVSGFDAECESKAKVLSIEDWLTNVDIQDGLDQSHSYIAWDIENHEDKTATICIDTHSSHAIKKLLAAAQSRPISDCTVQQATENEPAVEDQLGEKLTVINGDLQESHVITKPLFSDGHGLGELNFRQTRERMDAFQSDVQQRHGVSKPLSADVYGLAELNFRKTKEKMNVLSESPSFILSAKRSAETTLTAPQEFATIDASEENLTLAEVGSGSIHVKESPVNPKPFLASQEKISETRDDLASQSTMQRYDNPYQLIDREVLFAKATKEIEAKIFRVSFLFKIILLSMCCLCCAKRKKLPRNV